MLRPQGIEWKWLRNGKEIFPAMISAIEGARQSIRLETYIFSSGSLGETFLAALAGAQRRGVVVRVLVDAVGSISLSNDFWMPLREAGGDARLFNPLALNRFEIRNHRKLLVCDDSIAFVGGYNIAPEYEGDGVTRGWLDLGMRIEGPVATQLARSFDEMFALADFKHKRLVRFRPARMRRKAQSGDIQILIGRPGIGINPIKRALRRDLRFARNTRLMVAYFLPTGRLRRALTRSARQGNDVRLILAGKSDVALSQLAGQSLYRRLLKSSVAIHEYEPQILHAKLFVVDDAVYIGSANLDPRSLSINYEVTIRFRNECMAGEAREIFDDTLRHCRRIELEEWKWTRNFWARLKRRWAYFLLARIDPYIAQRQWQSLPD
jgi:cardiolipin synthase